VIDRRKKKESGGKESKAKQKSMIMSGSFSCCCISRPLPPNHERNLSWTSPPPKPNRPISSLTLRNHPNHNDISSRLIARVVSSDGVSLVNPVVGTKEEEEKEEEREEVHGAFNGVVDTKPPSPSTKVKKKKEDYDDDENRFKLRNGREVSFF
jgi:hypothetical protein